MTDIPAPEPRADDIHNLTYDHLHRLCECEAMSTPETLFDRLETYYDFQCEGGPLKNCVKWVALHAEVATLRAERDEHCDKCGRDVPRRFIAIELQDGAPIDDPAGFQWCVVCHSQRIVGDLKACLATMTEERDKWQALALGSHEAHKADIARLAAQAEALAHSQHQMRNALDRWNNNDRIPVRVIETVRCWHDQLAALRTQEAK